MRKPLIVLWAVVLVAVAATSKTNVDSDIIFDEGPLKESDQPFYRKVLNRVKRAWSLFDFGGDSSTTTESSVSETSPSEDTSPTTEGTSTSRETRSPDGFSSPKGPNDDEDINADSSGSGEPGIVPSEVIPDESSKTIYRMTLEVEEPWNENYSSKSSDEFRTFAVKLQNDINDLYEQEIGTQSSDVISIEKLDLLYLRVVVDLISFGNANGKQLSELIRNEIEGKNRIGSHTVRSSGFTFNAFQESKKCDDDQLHCTESDICVPINSRCDGIPQCPKYEDEKGCPPEDKPTEPSTTESTVVKVEDSLVGSSYNGNGGLPGPLPELEVKCRGDAVPSGCESNSSVLICPDQKCDKKKDCPNGEDEADCSNCLTTEFSCDVTRCIQQQQRCDGQSDCADGTDEQNCPPRECAPPDFSCDGRCIKQDKRCDGVPDCSDGRDESNCPITCDPVSQFKCHNDDLCISIREVCDNFTNCPDNSDEQNCQSECLSNEFRCKNGVCISRDYVCDTIDDCTDRSDESDCNQRQCDDTDFQCDDKTCIRQSLKCDGHVDCPDASDEDTNICRPTCESYEFQCNSGNCIPLDKRCDGRHDCPDSSDELNNDCSATSSTELPCSGFTCESNRQCISNYQVCDNYRDCSDGSDEANCVSAPSTALPCPDFACDSNRRCIPNYRVCDNYRDCSDGSDEANCVPREPQRVVCKPWEFSCATKFHCIPNEKHCDNVPDCPDSSDEENCAGLPLPNLVIYERNQIIKESREAVFQCRDEGPGRYKVKWTRENGLPLPPGSRNYDGRLEMPNIQREHTGTYYCEAIGVPSSSPGANSSAYLTVEQLILPTIAPLSPCQPYQATCYNRQCISKTQVCDGVIDCTDGSDESRCHDLCEPNEFRCKNKKCVLKTWRCDREDDCGDNSDEEYCNERRNGSQCYQTEFECRSRNQCIPRHYHCDGTNDCQDGSDEHSCFPMVITVTPPPLMQIDCGSTLTLLCTAEGVPVPEISWRKDWRHVPAKCIQTSVNGTGTLVCPNFQPEDSGAYTCEALNSITYIISKQDTIVECKRNDTFCAPGFFKDPEDNQCTKCFCFGISAECSSANLYSFQIPASMDVLKILNVQVTPTQIIVQRRFDDAQTRRMSTGFSVQSNARVFGAGFDENVFSYFALPDVYHGNQLKSYGGYLTYTIEIDKHGGEMPGIPDIIIMNTANKQTLVYKHLQQIPENYPTTISVQIIDGPQWKIRDERGERPASREDIMMTLVNVDNILLRTQYSDTQGAMTTISNIVVDSAQYTNAGRGQAGKIEMCRCPAGYKGLSCESCDTFSNYTRTPPPPWLGECRKHVGCPRGQFGDPLRGIPCQPCPCPHSYPPNQFTQECELYYDGGPICKCPPCYEGRRCERCAPGCIGDPTAYGGSCQPDRGVCDPDGSYSRYPRNGQCDCKGNVIGKNCSECAPNTFYLSSLNKDGCISCFCMGITKTCTSSRLYRDKIFASFARDSQGFQLAPEDETTNVVPVRNDQTSLFYDNFQPKVYYWSFPSRFLGNQLKSYGGYLTYTIRFTPSPGGLSSRNNAADVKLYSRNRVNLFYYGNITLEPDREQEVRIPILEQYWKREDGGDTNRENLLMALADLDGIYVKATYTTSTQYASLHSVYLDTAMSHYTGQEIAYAVEECACPVGYRGLSCESCDVGYKKSNEGLYVGLCEKCECNGRSEECNPETGECYNCRDNFSGARCDVCPPNYVLNGGRCEPLSPCYCDPRGEAIPNCPRGVCDCKVNVEGNSCNACRRGTFNLSAENPLGCSDCYCSDVSKTCHSSNLYYEQLPMLLDPQKKPEFFLTDRDGRPVISDDFILNPAQNEIGYRIRQGQDDLYWSLPPQFTGDKITSYDGNLIFTQRAVFSRNGILQPNYDVIINGNGKSIYWQNYTLSTSLPQLTQNVVVPLREGHWKRLSPYTGHSPATKRDILEVLSQISSILIRASFGQDTLETYLSDVALDVTISSDRGGRRALGVEECSCPPEYKGYSCQQCIDHYYKTYNNSCERCDCNNREVSCSLGPDNSVSCICKPGYFGKRCEAVQEIAGNNTIPPPPKFKINIIDYDKSIQIKQVGSTVRYTCSSTPSERGGVRLVWSRSGGELPRGRATDDNQGNLEIIDLRVSDSGTYVCTGYDGVSTSTQYVVLNVGDDNPPIAPTVRISPSQVQVYETEAIDVECFGGGYPQPSLEWRKVGGGPFSPNVIIRGGSLRIPYASKSDEGYYECVGRSTAGSTSANIYIYVLEKQTPDVRNIVVSPPSTSASYGQSVTLHCGGEIPPDADIEWRREDARPYSGQKFGNQLVFARVQPEDSGIYLCIIRSRTGRVIGQARASITISTDNFRPSSHVPTVEPRQQLITQGDTAEFQCYVPYDNYPGTNYVQWSKANEIISPRAEYLNNGRTLRIPNLIFEDRGIYVCHAVFNGRTYNISARLEVERREKPRIELHPPDKRQILSVGNSLYLHCSVQGIPSPTIRWSKADNTPFTSNVAPSPTNPGVLRFHQVGLNDAGEYVCTAENLAGRDIASAFVEVQAPPIITLFPGDLVSLVAGENLDLTCTASGSPTPTVQWTKQDPYSQPVDPLRGANQITAGPSLGRAEYQVLQVSSEDEGIYYCVAKNDAETQIRAVRVTVDYFGPPGVDNPAPPTPSSPEHFWVSTGSDMQITCAEKNPNLEKTWVRADRGDLPSGVTERDGTLYIRAATRAAEGEYVCVVRNEEGEEIKRLTQYIAVKDLPEITLYPPTQTVRPGEDAEINCSARGEEPIQITWVANHTLPPNVQVSGGRLSFKGITERDAGRYICMAQNIAGLREAAADVIVSENASGRQPRVRMEGDRNRVTFQGANLILHCTTDIPHQISWIKDNNEPLPPGVSVSGGILRINNIQPYHAGRYECSTPGHFSSDYVYLTVTRDNSCRGGYQCGSGECIDLKHYCDFHPHCADESDEMGCARRRRGAAHIRLKIEPSIDIIRVGSTVDLRCTTEGIPSSSLEWNKLGRTGEPEVELGSNVQIISANVLRIVDVTTSNAGTYRCSAQAETGRYTDDYTLKVQDNSLSDSSPTQNIAAKKILLKVGDNADVSCMNDLESPVSYSWLRQGGLPSSATTKGEILTLNKVSLKDAGLYTCIATNGEVKMEIPTFVVVEGTIPRFDSHSFIKLKTLFDAYMQFDIEVLFKPEDPNGLILYNGRQTSSIGGSDFVSFGLRNGYPEFKFDMGSGHATIVGRYPLPLGKWAKAKLNRNRKEGRLVINDEEPVIGTSQGRHQGLDLDLPFYVGSVPDFNEISKSADFNTGFKGCISRLVIKNEEQNLTRAGALDWFSISECKTCSENDCTNSGACQEAPNSRGYTCLCPKGFSGENCDRTGESCYPGLCGDGYCENTERGYVCKCPLGLAGSNCEHRINIRTPSFDDTSYIAYSAPRNTEKMEITLKLNPADSRDALILYAAQNDFGTGNYISITVKDRRLEFRIDTGSGSPVVLKSNTEIIPGSWMTVTAGRDIREAWLSIGQDMAKSTLTSGQRRELLLGTFLYLGGFDTSTGTVNPNVGVADGFRGCISHIDISRMDIDVLRSAKESSNIGECPSGNPCRESPCRNGATCIPEGSAYSCSCTPDYSGVHCEKLKNDCERYDPCGGKGECVPLSNGYKCHCTKGFSGQNCTIREYFTTSFSTEGDGWVELSKSLAGEGDDTEVEMNIVTKSPNGILMWHGQGPATAGGINDFFSIAVVNGLVEVWFELGSGLGHVVSDVRVNDGLPHRIIVSRRGNFATLTVDGKTTEGQSEGFLSKLNANGNIYIGGLPDPIYMTNGRYPENFNGCIRDIRIQNSDIIDVSNTAVSTVNLRRCPVSAE